jgi:ABC-type bacteriocin/lantibiotic exporter with double-glycine peptidase domain
MNKRIKFNIKVQETCHSCSAACMKALIKHHRGVNISERKLFDLGYLHEQNLRTYAGTPRYRGMDTPGLVKIAKNFDLSGFISREGDMDKIKFFIDNDVPILFNWQSPRAKEGEEAGHYSVINGYTSNGVYVADPGHANQLHYSMDYQKLNERWFDPLPSESNWMMVLMKPENRIKIPFTGRYI